MNKLKLHIMQIIACLLLALVSTTAMAQPASVHKVGKSTFTLTTFDKDGGLIASVQGVFLDNKGTAVSMFKPFIGAAKATVHDANGKEHEVESIMGANELYDVAKFRVKGATQGIATGTIDKGSAWLVPYSISKPDFKQLKINRVEKFNTTYNYYVFTSSAPENAAGCPMTTTDGKVIGIMHRLGETTIAIDINFIASLAVNGLSSLDPALRQTFIRTALPTEEKDAMTMMTLKKSENNPEQYRAFVDEYVSLFPTSTFGYRELAEIYAAADNFEDADKTIQTALSKATDKAEVHSDYADLIYKKLVYKEDKPFEKWTSEKALQEAEAAYQIKPEPAYRHQQAQIQYIRKEYQKAHDLFIELTNSKINNGELYYEAAQCKTQLKAPDAEIKTLLDSAVNVGIRTGNAAPYYLARGAFLDKHGKYREAVIDYLAYDTLAHPVNQQFFYTRYQAEKNAKMWQLALADIARCVIINPTEPIYFAEWVTLDLRVGRFEEAVKAAQRYVELQPEAAEPYFFLGLAQCQNNNKVEGLKNLQKAKEMGDNRAEEHIKKYK